METNTGGGLLKGLGRALSGDSLFLNFFTAESGTQQIGFSAHSPGKIIPFKLDGTNTIIGQKNAFLAAEDSVEIDLLKLKYSLKTNLEQEYSVVKDLSFKSSLEKELYS